MTVDPETYKITNMTQDVLYATFLDGLPESTYGRSPFVEAMNAWQNGNETLFKSLVTNDFELRIPVYTEAGIMPGNINTATAAWEFRKSLANNTNDQFPWLNAFYTFDYVTDTELTANLISYVRSTGKITLSIYCIY